LGLTLKNDLIADDLLVEAAKTLRRERTMEGSEEVIRWVNQVYSPYLAQFEGRLFQSAQGAPGRQRYRSIWKLCLDTLLLCSPLFVARNWYRRCRGRYPVLVLTHHLISDRPHRMGISTESFWRQVRFLQRHYRIVSLSHAVELLRSGSVTAPTVVLTFDDGYRDNFVNLRAIADEAEIPVSLFITTKPVDAQTEFQHDLANGSTGHLPLTWSQILYWAPRGAEFGSHTQTHVDCAFVDRTTLEREIGGSRDDMEARLGAPVRFFAFPFGKRENLSAQAIEIAASTYPYFVSGLDGENLPSKTINLPHLFRKNLYPNRWELELELQSVFQRVDRWKGLFNLRPRAESLQFKRQTASASSPASGELSSVCTKDN
jgi:peptidoglycan/xylan/chitin deacetylase (PgdA/CDA1 family)